MAKTTKPEVEPAGHPPLKKEDIETRVSELRKKFEEESKNLEDYIKNSQATVDAKKVELSQMQGEFNGLMALLNNYNW